MTKSMEKEWKEKYQIRYAIVHECVHSIERQETAGNYDGYGSRSQVRRTLGGCHKNLRRAQRLKHPGQTNG